jgi:hypothetical protein
LNFLGGDRFVAEKRSNLAEPVSGECPLSTPLTSCGICTKSTGIIISGGELLATVDIFFGFTTAGD